MIWFILIFDLLKEEAKVYPELNQLIESKLPDPRKIRINKFANNENIELIIPLLL